MACLPDCGPSHQQDSCLVACPVTCYDHDLPENCSRQELLEWRISTQESTTVGLLEKLSLLKADMLEHLMQIKHMKTEQINQREYFNDEVKDLGTAIAEINNEVRGNKLIYSQWKKLLNKISQAFEENVRDKWKTVNAAALTLRNLENHHVTSLADVRSRIARIDQAISELTEKLGQLADDLLCLCNKNKEEIDSINSHLRVIEQRLCDLGAQIEQATAQLSSAIECLEEQLRALIQDVERRLQCKLDKLENELHISASQTHNDLHKLDDRLSSMIKCHVTELEARIHDAHEEASKFKIDEELTKRVCDLEADVCDFKQQVQRSFKEMELRICKLSEELTENQRCTNEMIREEMRQGFYTMHDTVNNLKAVLENKLRISEENLQLELCQLRKLVALN